MLRTSNSALKANAREKSANASIKETGESVWESACFWETATGEDGGPDVDILTRKVTVQRGVPAEEVIDWTDKTEYLTEVRDTARAVSEILDEEDSWFQNLTKRMKELDPEWTWMDGVTAHSGSVPGPPPEPQAISAVSG